VKIITCVKHVPTSALTPRIAETRDRIEEEGLSFEVNEPDLYAIEEALHQRSMLKGSVTAITVGPGRAKEALHVAYAKGVDHAVHVVDDDFRGVNLFYSVSAIAEVAKKQGYDMIYTGIQADDDLQGQFGIALAEVLGIPVVTAVTEIRVHAEGKTVSVVRELGEGYKEELEVDLPCLITVQFGIRPLRYTPIMAIVKARLRKIESVSAEALGFSPEDQRAGTHMRVVELSFPPDSGRCELLDGTAQEMARKLVLKLVETGIV
jgi:electron transfer flavoprotein beta subunit